MRRSRNRIWIIGVALMSFVLIAIVAITSRSTSAPALAPHFVQNSAVRTIVIAEPGQQLQRKDNILLTELVNGNLPADAQQATVLSDSNCAPDAQGISHCLNDLQIGGTKVTVQHHHDMRRVPCLSPGETVNVLDLALFQKLSAS